MSQINLHQIIQQQQEQLVAIQAQIQALLAAGGGGAERGATGSNMGPHWPNQPFSVEKQEKWEDL